MTLPPTVKMGKDFWGPPVWATIHILAATLKPENSADYVQFLWLLTKLLPCDVCKINLAAKLQKIPPEKYMTNNRDAFFYSYLIHDLANRHISEHTGQVKVSPPFDDVKAYYFTHIGEDCEECKVE